MEIAVHDLGGTGAPMLLAHATGMHGLVWEPMVGHLGGAFHCVSFDERGHGDSGLPPGLDFDWRGFGTDALSVVDAMATEGPLGVGHSCGATALILAEQARPGTFAALYCFEPILVAADPPLGRDPSNWLAAGARNRREVFGSRGEAYATYASKPPLAACAPEALAAYVDHGFADRPDGTVELKCRAAHEALVYEMATAHDGYSHLDRVACPVMLACGAETDAVGAAASQALVTRFPGGRTEVLPGLGHLGPLQDPEAVAASVRRFFDSPGSG